MNRNIYKLRILLWISLGLVVGFLLYKGVVPSGKISYVYNLEKPSSFIGKLTPAERVELVKDGVQKIIGDPVYFSLRTPRKFNIAKLSIKYKNNSELPLIEAGVLMDKTVWRYNLQPIENKIIDDIALVWDAIKENGVMLLQREKRFNSIDEFLENLPSKDEIALYNYDLKQKFLFENYEGNKELSSGYPELSSLSLRGSYQFYTYIKDEDLNFDFSFLDLNKNKDSDRIELNLYYEDELIDSRSMEDDGVVSDNSEISSERTVNFKVANLPEGVYKIELKVNDDIVTKNITTVQSKLAFINKIWLFNEGKSKIELFTDGRELRVQTVNPGSLGKIKFGEEELEINETYKQFFVSLPIATTTKLILAKDGVIIASDGVFSFSETYLINPSFKKVTANLDIKKESINYVLAKYSPPEEIKNWKLAQVEFDISNAYREFYKNSFIISVPGLRADDEVGGNIVVDEIRVELEGKSLWEKVKEVRSQK